MQRLHRWMHSVTVSRPKVARNSRKSSPVATTRINEVRKRIIMIDDKDRISPLSAAPRATVTYATYVLSQYVRPSLHTWRSLKNASRGSHITDAEIQIRRH